MPSQPDGFATKRWKIALAFETEAISVKGTHSNKVSYKLGGATYEDNVTKLNVIYRNPRALADFSVQIGQFSGGGLIDWQFLTAQ